MPGSSVSRRHLLGAALLAGLRPRSLAAAAARAVVEDWRGQRPAAPELRRSRLIGYVWDPSLPAGTIVPSAKTGTVTFVIVHSGRAGLGAWHDERRDVAADYLRLYGEKPPAPRAVALSIDTNDT